MELLMSNGKNQTESGGSSSTESSSLSGGGLMFGQKIYFEDGSGSKTGSNKNRVRKSIKVECQVEGCRMDLTNAKTYYLRHKVCCIHSKASKVIVSGLHQRFCQQCSRFHLLCEFDLEKRSCRRRLACHNERRRKPQPSTTALLTSSRYSRITPFLYGSANSVMSRAAFGDPMVWSSARSGLWHSEGESRHRLANVFSHGSSSSFPMNTSNGTDSNCALSLLSNSNSNSNLNHQQQLQAPTSIWQPSTMITDRITMAQPHNQYLNQTWEFMEGEKSNSHYMSPVLGLSQISEPGDFRLSNGNTMSGYELSIHQQAMRQYMEPENIRAHNSSPQHFN